MPAWSNDASSGWTASSGATQKPSVSVWSQDLEALLPLAPAYDACEKQAGRVSSLSLVRYKTNDYSVPVAYGHRDVLVRGYVDQVVISCGSEVIAKHHRSYERDDFVYDPIHYLPLLERKPGALDQAAPLQSPELPEEFGTLRRLLELAWDGGVSGSMYRCSGCWRPSHSRKCTQPSRTGDLRLGALSLRRGESPGAVSIGGTAAQAGSGALSLPAPGEGEHHVYTRLYDSPRREDG